jgi:hypothetical protein
MIDVIEWFSPYRQKSWYTHQGKESVFYPRIRREYSRNREYIKLLHEYESDISDERDWKNRIPIYNEKAIRHTERSSTDILDKFSPIKYPMTDFSLYTKKYNHISHDKSGKYKNESDEKILKKWESNTHKDNNS